MLGRVVSPLRTAGARMWRRGTLERNRCAGAVVPSVLRGSHSTDGGKKWAPGAVVAAVATATCFSTAACEDHSSSPAAKPVAAGSQEKPRVVFVLGGPGAGKGTQCDMLVNDYGFVHLSAGDLLRAEQKKGTSEGELIKSYIVDGRIVPVEITVRLLLNAMRDSPRSRFLIDGFPRNEDNLDGWLRLASEEADVEMVLFYDVDEETRMKRLLKRGQSSGRADDNRDTIEKRFKVFLNETMPIVNRYARDGKVRIIDAAPSQEEVYQMTKEAVEPMVRDEVIRVTQRLIDAVTVGDYDTYTALSDRDLTAIEEESRGLTVVGRDFHKYYFDLKKDQSIPPVRNHIVDPHVRLVNQVAIVSYTRLVQTPMGTDAWSETRVWVDDEGHWKNVHFHRSAVGAGAAASGAAPDKWDQVLAELEAQVADREE